MIAAPSTPSTFAGRLALAMADDNTIEVGQRTHIHHKRVGRLARGESEVRRDEIPVLAKALGVRRDWLAWGEGSVK